MAPQEETEVLETYVLNGVRNRAQGGSLPAESAERQIHIPKR